MINWSFYLLDLGGREICKTHCFTLMKRGTWVFGPRFRGGIESHIALPSTCNESLVKWLIILSRGRRMSPIFFCTGGELSCDKFTHGKLTWRRVVRGEFSAANCLVPWKGFCNDKHSTFQNIFDYKQGKCDGICVKVKV